MIAADILRDMLLLLSYLTTICHKNTSIMHNDRRPLQTEIAGGKFTGCPILTVGYDMATEGIEL